MSPFAAVNFPYWGLITVGLASGIYHSTLKYHTQMADEMSMHLAMGCVLMQVFNFRKPAHIQKRNSAIIVGGLTSFIIYHCLTDEFVLHVAIFFALSVTVSRMTSKITKETVKDPGQKKKLGTLVKTATCEWLICVRLKLCRTFSNGHQVPPSLLTSSGTSMSIFAGISRPSSVGWVYHGAFYSSSTAGGIYSPPFPRTHSWQWSSS